MSNGRWKAWVRRAVCLGLVPPMSGCTYALWVPATQRTAVRPAIAGLVRNYPGPGDRAVVVTYRARGDGTDVNLVVPLDRTGHPAGPFAVAGRGFLVRYPDGADFVPVAGGLPGPQVAAVLSRGATVTRDRKPLSAHFTAADFTAVSADAPDRGVYTTDARPGTARLLAFRFDDAGRVVPVPVEASDKNPDHVTLPAGTRLLLVPDAVDRPAGDQGRDQAAAVVLTPVAVGADTAGTGLAIGAAGVVLGVVIVILPFVLVYDLGRSSVPTPPAPPEPPAPAKPTVPVTVPVDVEGDATITAAADAGRASVARR